MNSCDIFFVLAAVGRFLICHRSSSCSVACQDESLHLAEKTQMAEELKQRHRRLNSLDDWIYSHGHAFDD